MSATDGNAGNAAGYHVAYNWRDGRVAPNAARDEDICRAYLGIGVSRPMSLRRIAGDYGLTAERVRQILIRAGLNRRTRGAGAPVDAAAVAREAERERAELEASIADERAVSLRALSGVAGCSLSTLQLRLQRTGLAARAAAAFAERRLGEQAMRRNMALEALARLALELEHTPSQHEINVRSRAEIPSHVYFVLQFGSLSEAHRLAGLEPNAGGARRGNRNAAGPRRKTTDHKTEPNTERRGE